MKEAVYHYFHGHFVLLWKWDSTYSIFVSLQNANCSWKFETTLIGAAHAEGWKRFEKLNYYRLFFFFGFLEFE